MKKCLIIIFVLTAFFLYPDEIYKNIITNKIEYPDGFINYHLLSTEVNSSKMDLIIYIDGSGRYSSLGYKENNIWKAVTFAYILRKYFDNNYDILVPDKFNMELDKFYKNEDKNIMSYYTLENRVKYSIACIDKFLDDNKNYKNCYLLGISEGSIITAKIYNNLKNKEKINKIILLSDGGLSQYECFKIQYEKYNPKYKKALKNIDDKIKDIKKNPNSLTKNYLGWPYKRWSDFMFYRPIDDIEEINIPILLIHGDKDENNPVENSRYLNNEFIKMGKTNLKYIESKDSGHIPEDIESFIKKIEKWIKE